MFLYLDFIIIQFIIHLYTNLQNSNDITYYSLIT